MTRSELHSVLITLAATFLAACASQPVSPPGAEPKPGARTQAAAKPAPDFSTLWVRNAAEYHALATQAYAAASEDLNRFIEDSSWSALPDQAEAGGMKPEMKPAIIFDIDETLLDNVQFQLDLEPPFSDSKFDDWNAANRAPAVPGAAAFVQRAASAGVELFFVTNRRCAPMAGRDGPCPQERIALEDLHDAGIPADEQHVLLAGEKPDWTQEKKVRRDLIARDYRVIMLFGDDLGDFLACVRKRVVSPCTEPATQDSRKAQTGKHAAYWGDGWYVLPNPMYGSWTSTL